MKSGAGNGWQPRHRQVHRHGLAHAGAALFLASPAWAFVTGHIMVVHGGQIAK
ncbi:MAG: hypothetical protein K4571_03625 [Deltaproteobacteria bacterium]